MKHEESFITKIMQRDIENFKKSAEYDDKFDDFNSHYKDDVPLMDPESIVVKKDH